ncbi:DUF2939 domain-containing protein [Paraburkholderia sp. CNPSo 3157]|uniref:DUF2939 domain-containing protein n=1 Tax=Paraburkholderia franconis TaxID=2654983 RepID=A0A7X1TGK6_9BURK|nr:DUF2939 domain-containing protein [Paraburkholderia franconis]MPW18386.1 DUF2939 domain-containing protein [Paraburkholderia franconis]
MAGLVRTKGRVSRPLLITLIVIVIVAALGFAYTSPYISLDRLKRAADARDVETVNEYVDYPALRESLKLQVTGLLTRRLDVQHNGNPLAAIGAMIGVALIGPLVDAYATPDGVAALLNGMPPRGEPGERPPPPPAAPPDNSAQPPAPGASSSNSTNNNTSNGTPPPQPPETSAGYRGINEFVVMYQHGVGDTRYSAIFRRQGLFSWKLSAVDLNG